MSRNIYIAREALQAIDAAIYADQCAAFRQWQQQVLPHIGDAYRGEEEGHRAHLGASILGGECARAPWYNFRWATRAKFEGRILRLFNRGHLEEGRMIAALLMIGVQVYQQDEKGDQFRISFAEGHGGGSGDGKLIGIPGLEANTVALGEFKTHSEKSFIELAGPLKEWREYIKGNGEFAGQGVRAAKFEHYVQMQTYMLKMGLSVSLYCAVNKNTDDLYMEFVPLDRGLAEQFIERGNKIVWMETPPDKLSKSPGFWKCKFCDHKPVCHLKAIPDRNCRTCAYSTPRPGKVWWCSNQVCEGAISKETQLVGCPHYEMSEVYGK